MINKTEEKVKLTVGKDGELQKTTEYKVLTPMKLNVPPFKPGAHKVLLDPIPMEEDIKLNSGLWVPGDKEPKAIVVCVGTGVIDYEPGDVVIIGVPTITFRFIEGHAYVQCYESDIEGKYTNIKMTTDGPRNV